MPKPVDSRSAYVPALDGFRTIAVMSVLFYHLGASWAPGGLLGVAVFFTLSGYLITSNLLRSKYRRNSFGLSTFWLRRFRRLVPAVVVAVAAVFLLTATMTPGKVGERTGEALSSLLYFNNWFVIFSDRSYFDQFNGPGPLDHMWSLSIEEQFYLVWPLLLAGLFSMFGTPQRPRRGRRNIAVATLVISVASFAWMWFLSHSGADPTRVYEGTDTRAGGLLLGAVLAIAIVEKSRLMLSERRFAETAGAVGLAVIVVLVVLVDDDSPFLFGGGLAIISIASVGVIYACLHRDTVVSRVLGIAPMRWIGERSYGIYLWHLPVTVYLPSQLDDRPLLRAVIVIAVSFVLAAMSWTMVEDPIRRRGVIGPARDWFAARRRARREETTLPGLPRPVLSSAAVVLTAVAVIGIPAGVAGGPRPGDDLEADLKAMAAANGSPAEAAQKKPAQPERTMPDGDEITALGDSVMLASSQALQEEFPGIYVDGAVSRHYEALPSIISSMKAAGTLDQFVVLGFGTNGAAREGELESIIDSLGEDRVIILVIPYGDRWWMPEAKEQVVEAAEKYDNVYAAQWCQAATADTTLLRDDLIHPTLTGATAYSGAVKKALQQWVDRDETVPSACE